MQSKWLGAVLGLGLTSLLPRAAQAEDVPTVKMTDAGPERDLPVGTAYYITGDVDASTSEVRPVFVRVGTKTLFHTTGGSCGDFASHLGAFVDKDGKAAKALVAPYVGAAKASNVWLPREINKKPDKDFDKDAEVFLVKGWTPSKPKDETYTLLVPKSDFFSPVGEYCLFLYKTTTTQDDKTDQVRTALETYAEECGAASPAGCKNAQKTREDALQALGLSGDSKIALETASNKAVNPQYNLVHASRNLQALLGTWSQAEVGINPAFTAPLPALDQPLALDDGELGSALLSLLLQHQALSRLVTPKKPLRYFTLDGKSEVATLQVSANRETVFATVKPAPNQPAPLAPIEARTETLTFDSGDVSLRDLLEMLRGRVRIDGVFIPITAVLQQIKPLADSPKAPPDAALHVLDELSLRTRALARVIKRSLASPGDAAGPGSELATLQALGNWFSLRTLSPCNNKAWQRWGRAGQCPIKTELGGWPGYGGIGDNPLDFIAGDIATYREALHVWPEVDKALKTTITLTKTAAVTVVPRKIKFSQKNWVFSYVTPVVGFTALLSPRENFSVTFIGAQIHLVSNPADDPLWSREKFSDDVLRLFALELGMVTGNGPWGDNDRFSGWKGLPPFMVGGVIHPLPYTSAGLGGIFLQKRTSPLTGEKSDFYPSWYFSLSVQANIPDIVVGLKGRQSDTAKN